MRIANYLKGVVKKYLYAIDPIFDTIAIYILINHYLAPALPLYFKHVTILQAMFLTLISAMLVFLINTTKIKHDDWDVLSKIFRRHSSYVVNMVTRSIGKLTTFIEYFIVSILGIVLYKLLLIIGMPNVIPVLVEVSIFKIALFVGLIFMLFTAYIYLPED